MTAFSSAREKDATAVYCDEVAPQIAQWAIQLRLNEIAEQKRMPAGAHLPARLTTTPAWAAGRISQTQAWIDDLKGLPQASELRSMLSQVSMEMVTLHAYAELRNTEELNRSLKRLASWTEKAFRDYCSFSTR